MVLFCILLLLQISRAASLQHLNVGGTFITDASLFAIADNCPHLKVYIVHTCFEFQTYSHLFGGGFYE